MNPTCLASHYYGGNAMSDTIHDIQLERNSKSYGFLKGSIDDYLWFALVHKDSVDYGIDPATLNKGMGRITRLCIFREERQFDGNPFMPSMTVKRTVYVNFHRDWTVMNPQYRPLVDALIKYLERRYSFHIVR